VAFTVTTYAAAGEPRSIVAGDFNTDGAPDFATANLKLGGSSGSGVAVFYNLGNGTFGPGRITATGTGAFDVAAADVNRDGRTDLVVSNADANTVTVLLSSEAGLVPAFTWSTSASPRGIVAADLTRDGRVDLAVAGYDCDCVDIGIGSGDGSFTTAVTFDVGPSPESIVAQDFNRDGTLDLYVGTVGNSGAAVLFGRGDGSFVEIRNEPIGVRARGLDAADFDGDGRADVVHAGDASTMIARNIPGASFHGPGGTHSDARGAVAFDVNVDGWPDAAVASRGTGTIQVFVNLRPGNGGIGFHHAVSFAAGAGARALAAADVDGDGRADLVVANQYAKTVAVMRNQTPRFAATTDVK
jgi:hypothetical protein